MKRSVFLSTALVVLFALCGTSFGSDAHLKRYEMGSLPRPTQPNVKQFKLSNGIVGYLVEDHSLPFVRVSVVAKAGSIYDPESKVGLAALTTMSMRSGGAGNRTPEEFDAAVDNIGAALSISAGAETTTATLQTLTPDLGQGLSLLSDMLFAPRFDAARVKVAKAKLIESVLRDRDDPATYSKILFAEEIYGAKSPWARVPTLSSVDAINGDDLFALNKKLFSADNVLIAVAGDIDTKTFVRLADQYFSRAGNDKVEWPSVQEVNFELVADSKYVKGPKSQSFVRMGHLGVKRHDPDWYALNVLGTVLGGGNFKSRLMEDLRTRRGLVYSIGAGFTQGRDYGTFSVRFSTPQIKADEAIALSKKHVAELASGADISEEEFDFAKRSLLASAIFDMASASAIAMDRVTFDIFGYPPDYWVASYKSLESVSRKDVMNAAKKYLHPDALKVLVLGVPSGK